MEGCKLRDYGGDYEVFLEQNAGEAEIMAEKVEKQKEVQKKQIKAKSKVRQVSAAQAGLPESSGRLSEVEGEQMLGRR